MYRSYILYVCLVCMLYSRHLLIATIGNWILGQRDLCFYLLWLFLWFISIRLQEDSIYSVTLQLVVQYGDTLQFSGHVQSRRGRSSRNLLKCEEKYLAFPFIEVT